MSNEIQRVQYIDRQVLRAADLRAEQAYHREMRWRHNRALHLDGIVSGLTLEEFNGRVSVTPGMAIDAWGREVFLTGGSVIEDRHLPPNAQAGNYHVYVQYARQATGERQSSSRCDTTSSTRVIEEGEIKLLKDPPITSIPPELSIAPPDDPRRAAPVLVGMVEVAETLSGHHEFKRLTLGFTLKYVGLRAQRIIPQDYREPDTRRVTTLEKLAGTDAPLSVEVFADLHATRDLVVGENFPIETDPKPDPEFPNTLASGNAKVRGDAFLRGNVYTYERDQDGKFVGWVALHSQFKKLTDEIAGLKTTLEAMQRSVENVVKLYNRPVPVIRTGSLVITVPGTSTTPQFAGSVQATVDTQIPAILNANVRVAVSPVFLMPPALPNPDPDQNPYESQVPGIIDLSWVTSTNATNVMLTVNAVLGRAWEEAANSYRCEFGGITLNYVIIALAA